MIPPPTREVQQSKSDPESGQLHKEGKPDGFHYSEHRTVDSKHNIVVNVRITPANVNDVEPISDRATGLSIDIITTIDSPDRTVHILSGFFIQQ